MKFIVVDDERHALNDLVKLLREAAPEAEITPFVESDEAFDFLAEHRVDVAFLDIEMDGYGGLGLAEKYEALCPTVNIIFVTGHPQYTMDALKLHVSGYLLKPVRAADLQAELQNLRHPVVERPKCRMRVQTFGNFEVYVDGRPLPLTASKARECLAYLIDRLGARVTYPELAGVLWEDRPYDRATQNNTHQAIFTLMSALKEAGLQDILIRSRKEIAVDTQQIDCDYYALLNGNPAQKRTFTGEYMRQYSWGELTLAKLFRLSSEF